MIRCAVMIQDNLRFPGGLTFKGAAGVVLFNWAGCSFFQLLRDPHLRLPPFHGLKDADLGPGVGWGTLGQARSSASQYSHNLLGFDLGTLGPGVGYGTWGKHHLPTPANTHNLLVGGKWWQKSSSDIFRLSI